MPPADQDAWKRLGRLLVRRRIEIGARYKNKNLFAAERDLNRRMLWQIETGARDTYRTDTLRAIESAYMLVPGSLDRALAGGDLEPLPAEPPQLAAVPSAAAPHDGDDSESAAAAELVELLRKHPDDRILAMIAVRGGAKAETRLKEARGWLGVQEGLRNGTNG